MSWACHSLQGEQLTLHVASDKNWAFKWKFWKTCICHHELDSSIFKGFSDEIGSDINTLGVGGILCNEMSTFGRST